MRRGPRGLSAEELVLWRKVAEACGRDPASFPFRHEAVRPGDQRHMQADVARAAEVLGWRQCFGATGRVSSFVSAASQSEHDTQDPS